MTDPSELNEIAGRLLAVWAIMQRTKDGANDAWCEGINLSDKQIKALVPRRLYEQVKEYLAWKESHPTRQGRRPDGSRLSHSGS